MVNEKEIVNETNPDDVWKAVDDETRERVINIFLHLALDLVGSEGVPVRADDDKVPGSSEVRWLTRARQD